MYAFCFQISLLIDACNLLLVLTHAHIWKHMETYGNTTRYANTHARANARMHEMNAHIHTLYTRKAHTQTQNTHTNRASCLEDKASQLKFSSFSFNRYLFLLQLFRVLRIDRHRGAFETFKLVVKNHFKVRIILGSF